MPSLAVLRSKAALKGRVSAFLRWAKRAGWQLMPTALRIPEWGTIRLTRVWSEIRDELKCAYRRSLAIGLAKRRPKVFAGLEEWNPKEHRKFLNSLHPHAASVIFRVWTGCAMTSAHAYAIGKAETPHCQCGHEQQTVKHLIFQCPLKGECPVEIQAWEQKDNCVSMACLCPPKADKENVALWRCLCTRAIQVLSALEKPTETMDWKGHLPFSDLSGRQVYCARCLITRRAPLTQNT